jgi:hypothetical protein
MGELIARWPTPTKALILPPVPDYINTYYLWAVRGVLSWVLVAPSVPAGGPVTFGGDSVTFGGDTVSFGTTPTATESVTMNGEDVTLGGDAVKW